MIRILGILGAMALVSACSDGRGTQYSSQRAQVTAPNYVPVTPNATPLQSAAPVTATPLQAGATVPVQTAATPPLQAQRFDTVQPTQAVLTQPIALTPNTAAVAQSPTGAVPNQAVVTQAAVVTPAQTFPVAQITAEAPSVSLKPRTAPRGAAQPSQPARVIQASAPAAVATSRTKRRAAAPTSGRRYAKGAIYSACRQAGRKEASDRRCGCVQWVANRELSPAQQRRGAGYFNNQQGLQDARQSDNTANERFWAAWKAFGQQAGQTCRGS